jgi:DNA-binding transcriptional ArsR family regulator
VDAAITAIGHPDRRQILVLVRDRECSSSELAAAVGLTRPATSQHLRVLKEAGLVRVRGQGGYRFYRSDEERLEDLRSFLDDFWSGRIAALKEAAERRHRMSGKGP